MGHDAVTKLLTTGNSAEMNRKDASLSQMAPSWVAKRGYEAVLKLLMERDYVDFDAKHKSFGQCCCRVPLAMDTRR